MISVRRRPGSETGFTLVEVVVAMGLLTIGVVGAAMTIGAQATGGLSGAASTGLAAVNRGNAMTTATVLAQQKLETIKNSAATAAGFTGIASQADTAVTGSPGFTIGTTVSAYTGLAAAKYVTVTVKGSLSSDTGSSQGVTVTLATIVAQKP